MNRLTMRNSDGTVSQPTSTTIESAFYRLAEYEDLGYTPEDLHKILLRFKVLSFNAKMAELEKQGYRSGGWDEKTNKTAIVKLGEHEYENRIVGYIDKDLNIEWREPYE